MRLVAVNRQDRSTVLPSVRHRVRLASPWKVFGEPRTNISDSHVVPLFLPQSPDKITADLRLQDP
jgi:hypothetical protein